MKTKFNSKLKFTSIILTLSIIISIIIIPISTLAEDNESYKYLQRSYGAIPVDDEIYEARIYSISPYISTEDYISPECYPNSFDLSTTQYFPPIGNQGAIGSCVAYATTYYQFTYECALLNDINVKENTNYIKSPLWVYSRINSGGNNGTQAVLAYDFLECFGSVYRNQNPAEEYDPNSVASPEDYTNWYCEDQYVIDALKTRLLEWESVKIEGNNEEPAITASTDYSLNEVKKAIVEGKKVLTLTANFKNEIYVDNAEFVNEAGELVYEKALIATENANGNHEVVIVGYNDNVYVDLNQNGQRESFEFGAFKIANSWGTDYGNNGYCWIMYDAFNTISNAENLNITNRGAFGFSTSGNNIYFKKITVKNYNTDLIAQVEVNASNRSSIDLIIGTTNFLETEEYLYGYFFNKGGNYPYNGSIYFDFSNEFSLENITNENMYWFAHSANSDNYNITSISLIDNMLNKITENNELLEIKEDEIISRSLQLPELKLGDINYDTKITEEDKTILQNYLINIYTLSSLQQKLADINIDTIIDMKDSLALQHIILNAQREITLFDWENATVGAIHPNITGLNSDTMSWRADFIVSDSTDGLAPDSTKCIAISNTVGTTKTVRAALTLPTDWMADSDKMKVWVGNFSGTVSFEFRGPSSMSYKKWIGISESGWIEFELSGSFYKNGPDIWENTTVNKETIASATTLWISFENLTADSTVYLDDIKLLYN